MSYKLSILSHNLYFLYEWANSLGQSTRARLIAESNYIRCHDVVFFQEGFDPKPRNLLSRLLEGEYPFRTNVVGETLHGWDSTTGSYSRNPIVDNGGAFILSKWPIVYQQQHVFRDACGLERLENKGFVYAKILYNGTTHIHLINTHLQSDDPTCSKKKCAQVRASQLKEIHAFVARSGIPKDEVVVIGGDLNIIKSPPPETVRVAEVSTFSPPMTLEYTSMVHENLVVMEPSVFKGHDFSWDCSINSIGKYSWPTEVPQQLDYIFVAKSHASRVRLLEVETLLVHTDEPFQVTKVGWCGRSWTLQDFSDHFPVKATIEVAI